MAVVVAVVFNFAVAQSTAKKERRSFVSTASMVLFFVVFTIVLRLGIGNIVVSPALCTALEVAGDALVVLGAFCNVKGRFDLKNNWGDQIRIYDDHTLVTTGLYRYIRHPLYSGLFLIGYGAALVYVNWLGVVMMSAVFVPMMIHRAKLEEAVLGDTFKDYGEYMKRTGRFLPKIQR